MIATLIKSTTKLLLIGFLAAGIVCAVVSARVEYGILGNFYESELFAALAMSGLEATKLFLVFFNCQYTSTRDAKYMQFRWIFLPIRYALVAFSFGAMLLWTLYHLGNPNAEAQLSKKYDELAAEHGQRADSINSSFKQRKADRFRLDQVEVDLWHDRMNFEMNNVVGRTWEGPYFQSHRSRWEVALKKQSEDQEKLEQEQLAAIAADAEDLRKERLEAKAHIADDPASRNKLLSRALQPITGNSEPFWYTVLAVVISLMVTLSLEGTIWIWATVLAITVGDALVESLKLDELADKYASATRASGKIAEQEIKEFERRVVREKSSVLSAIRNLF